MQGQLQARSGTINGGCNHADTLSESLITFTAEWYMVVQTTLTTPDDSGSQYNQWWIRAVLKSASGLLLALALLGSGFLLLPVSSLQLGAIALILFAIYLKLELGRREQETH